MQEDFLHYLWEFQKWKLPGLKTTDDHSLSVISVGQHNFLSGPDFFNSRVVIAGQEWAGNVEIHINSSDWYAHHHETDTNYDNVVLHVVWNHDTEIFRKNNTVIPVLELKNIISPGTVGKYNNLINNDNKNWINCEKDFPAFDDFTINSWLERLYFERLEKKSEVVYKMLAESANNWEEVLFKMLTKNFGLNINGEAFLSLADSVPFSVVKKVGFEAQNLEALLMGQAGMLEKDLEETYYKKLQEEYRFLKLKFRLNNVGVLPVKYFRLRPDNFPTIRLAQITALYHIHTTLFSEVIQAKTIEEVYRIFKIEIAEFWESHYTFEKGHNKRKKPLSKNFIDLIIINTLVPLKFCYARKQGKEVNEQLLEMLSSLKSESNQVVKKFNGLRPKTAVNALQSQALLELKQEYCNKNRCLKCKLGLKVLQRNEQNDSI